MLSRPKFLKKSPALYHPLLLKLIVRIRRFERHLHWLLGDHRYAKQRTDESLLHRVKKHQSVLVRKLSSPEEQELQRNKVDNLTAVIKRLDGVVIQPGETFSFCKLVGKPTLRRGFKQGMELSRGVAQAGVGGGICQASNLIFWLALHSSLEIVERHHHSFDPFPDQGRVLPFASGATVMYNYRDLRIRNNSDTSFQLRLWLDGKCLNGDLRCASESEQAYTVYEKNHRFEEIDGELFRGNELWRRVIDKRTGNTTAHEHLVTNLAEVKYRPSDEKLKTTSSVMSL